MATAPTSRHAAVTRRAVARLARGDGTISR
jgi:hypothetical protein